MDQFSTRFRDWMDDHRLKALEVAGRLRVSEQTVHNWRSSGIPPRRRLEVEEFMRNFQAQSDAKVAELRAQTLVIETSREEFRRWNKVALAEGKIIEDWVKDGLNQMAQEAQEAHSSEEDPNSFLDPEDTIKSVDPVDASQMIAKRKRDQIRQPSAD